MLGSCHCRSPGQSSGKYENLLGVLGIWFACDVGFAPRRVRSSCRTSTRPLPRVHSEGSSAAPRRHEFRLPSVCRLPVGAVCRVSARPTPRDAEPPPAGRQLLLLRVLGRAIPVADLARHRSQLLRRESRQSTGGHHLAQALRDRLRGLRAVRSGLLQVRQLLHRIGAKVAGPSGFTSRAAASEHHPSGCDLLLRFRVALLRDRGVEGSAHAHHRAAPLRPLHRLLPQTGGGARSNARRCCSRSFNGRASSAKTT